ncbi:MAG: hypothetical protein QCH99_01260 [Candidatus Bathyarchaeota archaeon]|nr:hypothetical protein [Candidatus Bathyarchaeum tardum]
MRILSKTFVNDLLKPEGILHPILTRIKKDQTLMLAIRKNYINIYYRGGNILKITEHPEGVYQTFFDNQYNKTEKNIPNSPDIIISQDDSQKWVVSFSERKNIMDEYFSAYGKAEREFQQLLARENNYSSISNETEYFIPDIEAADPLGRFDIMAIRWLAKDRKYGSKCTTALIEMKYSDSALGGRAGLLKHLKDMDTFISDKEKYRKRLQTMESQFNQLDELELLKFNKGRSNAKVKLNVNDKPEVIFILANHNPRSSKLKKILFDPEIKKYEQSELFDLKFYVACFAGYGLHANCMFTLAQILQLEHSFRNKK